MDKTGPNNYDSVLLVKSMNTKKTASLHYTEIISF